ncbi:YidB family protein [Streptomyces sp. URMC 123]|uniref:YidB family protein n=1 Tax=Streptomyces sp. URMC 123 TaxID=3423403 RepID=UPI003F19BC4D
MATQDLGSLLDGLIGGGKGGGGLVASLIATLGSAGGGGTGNPLSGLIQQLSEGGLEERVRSWVGTGGNEAVSGPEVAQALPYQALDHVAQEAGISPESAADRLAQTLPVVVDRLTPQGDVPEGSLEDLIRARL